MRKPLLLSPVGSFESLHAAIRGGADAVYFGVEHLNMRTKSTPSITVDDIAEVTEICRQHHVKSYITLNTVMYDYDMQLVKHIVREAREQGVNAVIASDFAVFDICRQEGIPLHISTQANVSNVESVSFFAPMADVIVLARELSLKQVAYISQEIKRREIRGFSGERILLETFVHGALCMAVSGKCYLSLHEMNASANRGACVQNCRRPYKVTDLETGNELVVDHEYIMSPKDLCTIDMVDQMISSGISVFKIEGRSKSAEYVEVTTQCYREAIDSVMEGTYTAEKIKEWYKRLDSVYNRGFWEGYYLGRKLGEWTPQPGSSASEKKIYIGKATKYYPKIKVAEFEIQSGNISTSDILMVIGRNTGVDKILLENLVVNGQSQEQAGRGDKITFPFEGDLKVNDKLYKMVKNHA